MPRMPQNLQNAPNARVFPPTLADPPSKPWANWENRENRENWEIEGVGAGAGAHTDNYKPLILLLFYRLFFVET